MEVMAVLKSFIYVVSSSLFVPVLLLLTALSLWLVVYSGGFCGLWLARRRLPRRIDTIDSLKRRSFSEFSAPVRKFCQRLVDMDGRDRSEVVVLNLLRETEHGLWASMDRLKMLIRIGPGLGLIGTLIPMGTGLASLGQGDLTRLSGDLVIAFTTTVVGMSIGLLSCFFFTVQHRWAEEDVKNMELAAELLIDGPEQTGKEKER